MERPPGGSSIDVGINQYVKVSYVQYDNLQISKSLNDALCGPQTVRSEFVIGGLGCLGGGWRG